MSLVPAWSRTDLGTAGPLPGAKRMPGTGHPKGHSSLGLKYCVDTAQIAWRFKTTAEGLSLSLHLPKSWDASPVKDSPLNYISSLSPDGGVGFRGEVRASHSCEHQV